MPEALILIPLLLAGCSELLPQVEERGACTLDRVTERVIHSRPLAPDEMIELEAPHVVTLKRNDLDLKPEGNLIIEGDGWQDPENPQRFNGPIAAVVAPDGKRSRITYNMRPPELRIEHTVGAPGTWIYTVEWELIDCRQVVSVEVLPPD